ncbi:alpha/beta-hydrolase [Eremomyces bilateralis CBS 781.70]|uniref:Alpha/beta-hydrolase n=1 Tax=Eremomyces bilateralis CBS 781.70 TaxID=1392243 RepID=A0A6G1GHN7_9PEZI|nr:alpha/beta-hydrolase [Eremomyces bilateralis CBS 781.70]KAF1817389.1 alpha/beta-hydrolase [Eremomyces bilateralis CBS 781.70]
MRTTSSIFALALLTGSYAIPHGQLQNRLAGIQWADCPPELNAFDPHGRTFGCGTLEVPLDYTGEIPGTLKLDLLKVPAMKESKKGSILFNWGGPGGDGVFNMASASPIVQPMTGGEHDLISWDPRGTGETLAYNCYPNATDRAATVRWHHGQFANASEAALGRTWAEGKILADDCAETLKDIGSLVGTAFTVRDMFQIVDALGEDGKLRYWGFSYGTTLGATALAMFPDRIDRAILDGVQNPMQHYHTFGDPEMYTDSDETWQEFLKACMENPNACALAKHASSAGELGEKIDRLIDNLKEEPIPAGQSIFGYSEIKGLMIGKLYYPSQYSDLADQLEWMLTRNITAFSGLSGIEDPQTVAAATSPEALFGIRCSDKVPRTDNLELVRAELEGQIYRTSTIFGDTPTNTMTACAQWHFAAKERYSGDFRVKTSSPALIIGNTWDPVTPLKSARTISELFEGSALLQHNGHGHMTIAQPSTCTSKHIADYFLTGTLPQPGTICEPDTPLFHKKPKSS